MEAKQSFTAFVLTLRNIKTHRSAEVLVTLLIKHSF